VTLNGTPVLPEAGAPTETLETLMSAEANTLVVELLEPLSFPGVGSETWSWSMAVEAVTEKLWADGSVQVTDQLAGEAGTVTGVEVASEESATVTGLVEAVVQSAGSVSVSVVSTFVGP
jgi:hypothetical protein